MNNPHVTITLQDDDETGLIERLPFVNRMLHRQLRSVDDDARADVVLGALELGAEMLARVGGQGDLRDLAQAVERLDEEATRIVSSTTEHVERTITKSVDEMASTLQSEDGPFAGVLRRLDPAEEGNVVDDLRDLVASTAKKATAEAVKDLSESTHDIVQRLAKSVAAIEKIAAVEEARFEEAQKGTAKGIDHERDTETLLGELAGVAGDGLDDVSTAVGLKGTKKGDKILTPKHGCPIVTEEKCTGRMTESKYRTVIQDAMDNRGTKLGMVIVDDESKVPGNQPFHVIDDDKVVVVADRLALRLVYALLRAKSIELAKAACAVDDQQVAESLSTMRGLVEDIRRALERFKLLRTEHTKAGNAIKAAVGYVDELAETIATDVTEIMAVIDGLAVDGDQAAA